MTRPYTAAPGAGTAAPGAGAESTCSSKPPERRAEPSSEQPTLPTGTAEAVTAATASSSVIPVARRKPASNCRRRIVRPDIVMEVPSPAIGRTCQKHTARGAARTATEAFPREAWRTFFRAGQRLAVFPCRLAPCRADEVHSQAGGRAGNPARRSAALFRKPAVAAAEDGLRRQERRIMVVWCR
jgi:hypothetical protein